MATPEALSEIFVQSQKALAETLAGAFQNLKFQRAPAVKLAKFYGRPQKVGEPTLNEWFEELKTYCRQLGLVGKDKVAAVLDHLGGVAKEEVYCCSPGDRDDYSKLLSILQTRFGSRESVQSFNAAFYSRKQGGDEGLADFSRALVLLYSQVESAATDPQEHEALMRLKEKALREQFVKGVAKPYVRHELHKLGMDNPDLDFYKFRDLALKLYQDFDETSESYEEQSSYNAVDKATSVKGTQNSDFQKLIDGQTNLAKMMEKTNETLIQLTDAVKQLSNDKPKFHVKSNLRCSYCSRRGHEASECFKKKKDAKESELPKPSGPIASNSSDQQSNSGKAPPLP